MKWLKQINFSTNVYPEHVMNEDMVPSCIFVPSKDLMRKMIMKASRCTTIAEIREAYNAYWSDWSKSLCIY